MSGEREESRVSGRIGVVLFLQQRDTHTSTQSGSHTQERLSDGNNTSRTATGSRSSSGESGTRTHQQQQTCKQTRKHTYTHRKEGGQLDGRSFAISLDRRKGREGGRECRGRTAGFGEIWREIQTSSLSLSSAVFDCLCDREAGNGR